MKSLEEMEKALCEAAGRNYRANYNCAESVLRAFCEQLQLDVTPDALRVAAGFGGGIYAKEGPCGAATGSVMVLGILAGRTDPSQDKKPMKDLTRDFMDQFVAKFGDLSCGCLNPYANGTPEAKENCHAITAGAAALLMKFIEDRGLYSGT